MTKSMKKKDTESAHVLKRTKTHKLTDKVEQETVFVKQQE